MPEQSPRKTIFEQGQDQVKASIAPLAEDEQAVIVATADNAGVKVGGAVDLGPVDVGGHVEKSYGKGWGWFLGGMWRKKK